MAPDGLRPSPPSCRRRRPPPQRMVARVTHPTILRENESMTAVRPDQVFPGADMGNIAGRILLDSLNVELPFDEIWGS